ncbi:DUF262 domain-containing protein [Actinomadura rubteroloni]|nr:DUF262 domain-containing protein [Actinomadura rubteroloni]
MFDVERLVNMAWSGHIRVPHFQRDFRWQRIDVIRLFDSIVRGYPVGSLLLWRRSAEAARLKLGILEIDAPATEQALWVVDGQQRIISLANALHESGAKDSRFSLAYDLRIDQFVSRPQVDEALVIPLPVIFDLVKILRWFGTYPEAADYVVKANEITKTLRQFSIPAYEVAQGDAQVLQDIFDRMNNYGKRLSRAEVFSALFAGHESKKGESLTFDVIAQNVEEELGFGVIDNDTVLKAVLARRGPDTAREIRNEFSDEREPRGTQSGRAIIEFPDEDRDTAYRLGEAGIKRAVEFLQDEVGVPHFSMLPYRHLLIALTRFFAHFPNPDSRNRLLLRRWFWRAAVTGPEIFKGSTTGATRAFCFAVQPDDLVGSLQNLLGLVDRPDTALPDLRRFRSNEAATKIVLCSWWGQVPRSLDDGEPFEREDLSETLFDRKTALDVVRYIIPRHGVPADYRLWAADRVLAPPVDAEVAPLESKVIQKPATIESDKKWYAALASHCITPQMSQLLARDQIVAFLMARQEALQKQLADFLARRCEWKFENTPSLVELLLEDLGEEPGGGS